jgi:hypothetical protein
MKIITIYEETKIPGTDIILEAGDKIQVQEATFPTTQEHEALMSFIENVNFYARDRGPSQNYKIGLSIGTILWSSINESAKELLKGIKDQLDREL